MSATGKPAETKMLANGLPDIPAKKGSFAFAVIMPAATAAIGLGMAYGINRFGADAGEVAKKIALVKSVDGHWIFASAFLFSKMVQVINFIPMKSKDEFMTGSSGNLRANMFFYKSLTASKDGAIVALESEGSVGEYNRANRSIGHFIENSLGFVLTFPLVAYVFPKQTLTIMGAFCVGRIAHQVSSRACLLSSVQTSPPPLHNPRLHTPINLPNFAPPPAQVGYSLYGYGGHGVGFLISLLSQSAVDGLGLLVAGKAFGYL